MSPTTDPRAVAIACLQFEPRIGEVEANLDALERLVRAAAAQGAELIVAPELADTGYVFADRAELASLASPIPSGAPSRRLAALAAELGVHIVSGLAEAEDGKYYNASGLFGPQGFIGGYRKLHLWDGETEVFDRSPPATPVYDTALGRIAIAICYDGWFPELFRAYALAGAQIVAIPTNWVPMPDQPDDQAAMSNILHQAAAHSNGLVIACADRVGVERGQPFIGQSVIVDATGWRLAGPASRDREEILIARATPGAVETIRAVSARNHVLADRRPDAYGPLDGPLKTGGDAPATTEPAPRPAHQTAGEVK
ncbi:nitrilase family protein [Albimonas sp. CAU 1670]|uniref:nitrilase family protein n=1 Tax=Albimonas sp. CAU 1670 TaxID=3032599 RepID=UPI0023DB1969|nr:nitrilase family protein [Albimonas sp. CAU 1670]MDF2234780.1 nitrilase family protein [Albimonas sp. CAU 1670]